MTEQAVADATSQTPAGGRIGNEIFDQVEELTSREGITRQAAFERISEETGRASGTVSANYYRVARLRRGGSLRRKGGGAQTATGRRSRNGSRPDDVAGVLKNASDALEQLAAVVIEQDKELRRLREFETRVKAMMR